MPIAICQIRQDPHYRRYAFETGLRKAGYRMVTAGSPGGKHDLLVIWNRYGSFAAMADTWEAKGGTVLVCENGYVGKDEHNHQYYAISAHGHNGSGWWPEATYDRFEKLNLEINEWQKNEAGHLLICGQRGIGSSLMASPPDWHKKVLPYLMLRTKRPIRTRLHPGNNAPTVPLEEDLKGAYACVIWSSSSGIKSLLLGIPVLYAAPYWMCSEAAEKLLESKVDTVSLPENRAEAMQKMAWAQWSVKEIEEGTPFILFQDEIKRKFS